MGQRSDDIALLKALGHLEVDDENDFPTKGKVSASESSAFESMLGKLTSGAYAGAYAVLTQAQRKWAKGVKERAMEAPEYLNEWSSGKVPRGKEVPTPAVLQNLPKSPPPRRREE